MKKLQHSDGLGKKKPQERFCDEAMAYVGRGFSVIPIRRGTKNPALASWKGFQTERPSEAELRNWCLERDHQIAIVTGQLSGVCVVDLDTEGAVEFAKREGFFEGTPRVKTSKGYHLYFRYKPGVRNFQKRDDLPGIDLRGEGGYVVAPPSIHESGHVYAWERGCGLDDLPLAKFPDMLLARKSAGRKSVEELLASGSHKGSRNHDTTRLAGHFASQGLTLEECTEALLAWNQKNSPPLPEEEVRRTVESIHVRHMESSDERRSRQPNMAIQLIELLTASSFTYFHDEQDEPYVRTEVNSCWPIFPVRSSMFRRFIRKLAYENLGRPIKDTTLNEVLGFLSAKACFDGEPRKLSYRVARHDGAIWVDLGIKDWSAVKIDQEGWSVVRGQDAPILFRRFSHMEPLPIPQCGGNLDTLAQLVKVTSNEFWTLLKVWLVTSYIPDIPRPVLILHGLHGAGKSSVARLLGGLVDPSTTSLLTCTPAQKEFAQVIHNRYAIALDNLQRLSQETSDTICMAVTGGAFSKKKLYTDDEDVIFKLQRLFIINGISVAASSPDLLDRSLLVELDRIPEAERREEKEIMPLYEQMRPQLLGAIFDSLSTALKMQHTYSLLSLPRMADWAKIGYAVAEALGVGGENFQNAYSNNAKQQHHEVVFTDTVASSVLDYAKKELAGDQNTETITPTGLYRACRELLDESGLGGWPRSVPHFTRRLKVVSNNLRAFGVTIEFSRKAERLITVTYNYH